MKNAEICLQTQGEYTIIQHQLRSDYPQCRVHYTSLGALNLPLPRAKRTWLLPCFNYMYCCPRVSCTVDVSLFTCCFMEPAAPAPALKPVELSSLCGAYFQYSSVSGLFIVCRSPVHCGNTACDVCKLNQDKSIHEVIFPGFTVLAVWVEITACSIKLIIICVKILLRIFQDSSHLCCS